MALTDQEIDFLEQQIPELAELATRQAFWQTLASGDSVLIAEDGFLVEVKPDGNRTIVQEIEKPQIVEQRQFTIPKA